MYGGMRTEGRQDGASPTRGVASTRSRWHRVVVAVAAVAGLVAAAVVALAYWTSLTRGEATVVVGGVLVAIALVSLETVTSLARAWSDREHGRQFGLAERERSRGR